MKEWLRKLFVIFVTILTLGFYIPPLYSNTDADDNENAFSSKENVDEDQVSAVDTFTRTTQAEFDSRIHDDSTTHVVERTDDQQLLPEDYIIQDLTEKAKEQALMKLGPRIFEQVEDEFIDEILPNIEAVLVSYLQEAKDELPYFSITEQPTSGLGERIFHIYDHRTEEDVIRFHVRRENRPLEGYWFNFHYHVSDDNFEKHYDIGEIYWDKNIPPKWMS